ncbi:MAG: right-handed parallel beta-helix repeat-containing protein [Anaerolineae bacterium]|nr:right-handed parallel beta-helix repeat-containing protein [Anaerolineae bacterium]
MQYAKLVTIIYPDGIWTYRTMKRLFSKRQSIIAISALLIVLIASFIIPQLIVRAATITVNTALYPGIGADGLCSLDEAVANANVLVDTSGGDCVVGTGVDTIIFGGAITNININASLIGTDPGDVINGGNVVTFTVTANGVTISGLELDSFSGPAILLDGFLGTANNVVITNNLIYDTLGAGVSILGPNATNALIQNNVIGFNSAAPQAAATPCLTSNSGQGVLITNADGAVVNNNILSCNAVGVFVTGSDNVVITNNTIGTDSGMSAVLGNSGNGITASNVVDMTINDNFIDNNQIGISLTNGTCTGTCTVNRNTVGTATIGISGNRDDGIFFSNVFNYDVDFNIIRDNAGDGVAITNGSQTVDVFDTIIENNNIGIFISNSSDVDTFRNTIQNNNSHGISVAGGSTIINIQGGTINNNAGDGLSVVASSRVDVNSGADPTTIFANGGLGIDLDNDGVTAGNPTANSGQRYPDILSVAIANGANIVGSVDYSVLGAGTYNLHFYRSATCDPSNFGEGETYIETQIIIVPTGATQYTLTSAFTTGFITVFAVDPQGNLSEFSRCAAILPLIANFNPIPALADLCSPTIFFDNLSTVGAGITYDWDFDDGVFSTLFEPSHVYTATGLYNVELCVNGPGGLQVCTIRTVTINNCIPTDTPVPTNTSVPTNIPVSTNTPIPSNTPLSTASVTGTSTRTATVPATNTATPLIPSATNTQIPTVTPQVTSTATLLPTSTGTVTIAADTATAIVLTQAALPKPTLVYFGIAAPIRQCVARQGVLLCTEIDPLNPEIEPVTVTLEDGTVITAGLEPYVTKLARPNTLLPGFDITYILQVVNPTDSTIRNVSLVDDVPEAIAIRAVESTSGSVSFVGQRVTFRQASLGAGASITITIRGEIRSDRVYDANELTNIACVTSSGNSATQCATFGFNPTTNIDTGETPFIFVILRRLLIVLGMILVVSSAWIGWRQFSNILPTKTKGNHG